MTSVLVALMEQDMSKHHNNKNDGDTFKVPNSLSPSFEIISSKKSNNNLTVGDDEGADSVATNDTNSTTGSKRKRVRHRKGKKCSMAKSPLESEVDSHNIQTPYGRTANGDTIEKKTRGKPIPGPNMHVR